MRMTVMCVNVEKRIQREPGGKTKGFIYRAQFEAVPVEAAPENKAVWPSTPALSLDIPNFTGALIPETGQFYTLDLAPAGK